MKYLSIFAIVGVLFGAAPAMAMEPTDSQVERCETAQTQLADRQEKLRARFDSHEANYEDRVARLETLADDADAAGVDSSALRSDIATLEVFYEDLEGDFDALMAHGEGLLGLDCSTLTQEVRKAEREEGKVLRAALRSTGKELHTFVQETLRPDVKEVRGQLNAE